jgi:porin
VVLQLCGALAFADQKSGYTDDEDFGGPGSVEGQLEEDDRVKDPVFRFPAIDRMLEPWFGWKGKLNENHGLALGFDFNMLYQALDGALPGEDDAAGGVVRAYGRWAALNRGTDREGALFFKVEHRDTLGTDLAPAGLAGQAGYIGVTGLNFSDPGLILGDLNWQQRLGKKAGLIVGRYDPNDYLNVLGYVNPWSTFSNLSALLDASLALPDWSWGVGAGRWFGDGWYAAATINDANGSATQEEFFDGGAEFVKLAEVGWSPSRADRYFRNFHVTAWHVDERDDAGIDSAEGVSVGGNWTWNRTWMVFGRVGVSDGDAPIYNESASAGFGRLFRSNSDVLGLVYDWGDPPQSALDAQKTAELFYRLTLSQNLQVTPSLQWLGDPALNTQEDDVMVFGLRLRLSL